VSRDESEDLPERILIKELSGIKVMIGRSPAYIILSLMSHAGVTVATALLWLLLPLVTPAQDSFTEDTINISAVTVTASASVRHSPYTVVRIDPAIIAWHEGDDLATLLQSATLLSVKRYGNTGIASVSVRGLSGSHTLVTWNGLTVNTPGNGFSDFSIIPLNAVSTVKITSGGSDLDDITGYIGGKIELITEPVFEAGTCASVVSSAGSFGSYALSASLSTGTANLSSRVSIWGDKARNDFHFINNDAPGGPSEEKRINSASASGGVIADISYRVRGSLLSSHVWYNNADRQLPGPVTTVQQNFGERQHDRSAKGVIDYSLVHEKLTAAITAGASHDHNRYFNAIPELNGDNSSETFMVRARIGYRLTGTTVLLLNAGDEYETAHSLSFRGGEQRNIFSVSLAAKVNPLPRLRLQAQVRHTTASDMKVIPELTAGAAYLLSRSGEHVIKASISRNTKLPCLNDLYWVPGGNSLLMPETATGGETSWSFARVTSSGARNSLDVTLHASRVKNLIQWIPGESGLWSAENVRSVRVTGAEVRAGTHVIINDWNIRGYLNYAFTRSLIAGSDIANDRSVGSQLIYAPVHHVNLNVNAGWKWFRTGMTAAWESKRFTVSDNSEWLPSSFLADAFLGTDIRAGKTDIRSDLTVSNILNTPSESVRNYPMPLRTYKLKLTIAWSTKPRKNVKTE